MRDRRKKTLKRNTNLEDRDLYLGVLDAAIVVDVDGREDAARDEGEEGVEDALCLGGEFGGSRLKMVMRKKKKRKSRTQKKGSKKKKRAGKIEHAEQTVLDF